MAKKVRKDGERKEEKKTVFEPPEFNEKEYLTEQLHNIRLNVLFVILGIPIGLIWAFIAATTGSTLLGFGICLGAYILGVYVLKIALDVDLFSGPKKTIATTLLMFLFTSLAFAVLLSNPPTMDQTPPSITNVMVDYQSNLTTSPEDGWEILMVHKDHLPFNASNNQRKKESPDRTMFSYNEGVYATVGDRISIMVRAADASGLRGVWLEWGFDDIDMPAVPMERLTEDEWREMGDDQPYSLWGEHYYQYQFVVPRTGSLWYRIRVEDTAGHEEVFEIKELVDTIRIEEGSS